MVKADHRRWSRCEAKRSRDFVYNKSTKNNNNKKNRSWAKRLSGQSQHPSTLPGARRRVSDQRGRARPPRSAPTIEQLQALLAKLITRLMRLLTRHGHLIEEQGMALGQPLTYLAEPDSNSALTPLQAASCTYSIALGPRAGQKVLSMQSLALGACRT